MTRTTRFDPRPNLICVSGTVAGPRGETRLRLVVDTGASLSLLVPRIIAEVGYGPRDARVATSIGSPLGRERGFTLTVARFATLGFSVRDFPVHVFDMAERELYDGVIGNNFLRLFNYQVRSREGCIRLEYVPPPPPPP